MAITSKWQPRRTMIDLYAERDRTQWYWRLLGVLSASIILLGFLVFPASFQTATDLQSNQGTISIVAVILLALGYSLSVALWFICTNWLFQLDVLFMPCLSSCVLGTLNIGIALGIHPATRDQWTTASISALILALASSIIYAALAIFTLRKISSIRSHDSGRRNRADSESLTLLPEDELQRQQLLRLLLQKEGDKASPAASQSTFRIDIPENSKVSAATTTTTYLAAPTTVYGGQNRNTGSIPIEQQFALLRGDFQEAPPDRKLQALVSARERSSQSRSRETSEGPPVIINTRTVDDIGEIPLSERHPLEREDYIRGTHIKDDPFHPDGVYRPEDEEYSYRMDPGFAARRAEVELEDSEMERRLHTETRELEAEVIPRIEEHHASRQGLSSIAEALEFML
ncbi:hypothetical protein MMC18_008353 [Xylographa bjoerkii]|nr:hypothetical protein [Xylographa bjoerkii]